MNPKYRKQLGDRFFDDLVETVWPALEVVLVEEYKDRLSQRRFGDGVVVSTQHRLRHIDWKASQAQDASFPIELLQDWQSLDIGWYYTLQCDDIWFGHYVENLLVTVDVIDFGLLRQMRYEAVNGIQPKLSDKGQGHTVFVPVPLSVLRFYGVSECVFKSSALPLEQS